MQFLIGRNQTQILEGENKSLEEDVNVFSTHKLGKQPISHTQLWSVLLFTSNWQKTWAAPTKQSTKVPEAVLSVLGSNHPPPDLNPWGPMIFVSDYFALWEA